MEWHCIFFKSAFEPINSHKKNLSDENMNYGVTGKMSIRLILGGLCKGCIRLAVLGAALMLINALANRWFSDTPWAHAVVQNIGVLLDPISTAHAYQVALECETVQKSFGPYEACRKVMLPPEPGAKSYAERSTERQEEEKRLFHECLKAKQAQEASAPEKRVSMTPTCEGRLRKANGKTWTSF